MSVRLLLLLIAFVACGATCKSGRQQAVATAVDRNNAALAEKSRVATTGAHEAIRLAPVNPPTKLAEKLIERAETIQGLPVARLDIPGILATNKQAIAELTREMTSGSVLIKERPILEAEQEKANEALMAKGRLYEEEHKQNIITRIWRWSLATFGIGGIIALLIFFPVLIPIFTRICAGIVGVFPKLAGFLGVVSTKVVDGIVKGVQNAKVKIDENKSKSKTEDVEAPSEVLKGELRESTDADHKALIDERKQVLASKGELTL